MEKLIKGILIVCLLAAIVVFTGCKKDETAETAETVDHSGHDHAQHAEAVSETAEKAEEKAPDPAEVMAKAMALIAKATEQTKCPIMGGGINKDLFVEYKGKKVYFCCKGCIPKFEANPEKYVSKLPHLQL